jgi:hypothetical protein
MQTDMTLLKKTDRCDISKGVGVGLDIEGFQMTFISYTNSYPHAFLYNSNHVRLEDIQIDRCLCAFLPGL